MSKLGTKKVSTVRRLTEGVAVGVGIAFGIGLVQAVAVGLMILVKLFMGY